MLLIVTPVIFSTLFLLVLNGLWGWTVNLAERETRYSQVIGLTDIVLDNIFDYNSEVIGYIWTGKGKLQDRAERVRADILRKLDTVEKLVADEPEQADLYRDVRKLAMAALDTSKIERLKSVAGEDILTTNLKRGMQAITLAKEGFIFSKKSQELLDAQQRRLAEIQPKQESWVKAIKVLALTGFGVNIAVALALVFVFSKYFKTRIQDLMRAAHSLLTEDEEAPPLLKGNDELAYLSRCLNEIKTQLNEAAARRQAILSMVAHDVRSPLMAAQLTIDLMKRKGDQSPQLSTARDAIKSTVKFVNELLEKERFELPAAAKADANPRAKRTQVFHKVLLFALIPLALQSVWLIWINKEVAATEKFAATERQRQQLIIHSESLSLGLVRAGGAAALYIATTKEPFKNLAQKEIENMRADLAALQAIAARDPARQKYVNALNQAVETGVESFRDLDAKAAYADPADTMARVKTLNALGEQRVEVANREKLILQDEREQLDRDRIKHTQLEQSVQRIFIGAIAGNIALSFILMWLFTRDVSARLNRLTTKVQAMPNVQGQASIGGNDELAQLDEAVTGAATQLNEAAEQRLAVISALTIQMKAPLIEAIDELNGLKKEGGGDEAELASAERNIQRVLNLINDLMDIKTIEAGSLTLEKRRTSVAEVIEMSVEMVRALADAKDIRINCEIDADVAIDVDSARVAQVLNNLLGNAIKFSPDGSAIQITSSFENAAVRIAIADEGPGIDADLAERIFDPRFQVKRDGKGFGLGLAIAKSIVESHGGTIALDTTVSAGSKFVIVLPAVQETKVGENLTC